MRGAMNWRNVHNTPDVCSAASLWILRGWCMIVGRANFPKTKGKWRMEIIFTHFYPSKRNEDEEEIIPFRIYE